MSALDEVLKITIDTDAADAKIEELEEAEQKSAERNSAFLAKFDKEEESLQKAAEDAGKEYESRRRPTRRPRDDLNRQIDKLARQLRSCNNDVIGQCRNKQRALLDWYRNTLNIELKKESLREYRRNHQYSIFSGDTPERVMYITYTDGAQVYKSEFKLILDYHDETKENLVSMRLILKEADRYHDELPEQQKFQVYQLVRHLLNVLFTEMIYQTTYVHEIRYAQLYYDGLFRTRTSQGDFNLTYTMSDEGAQAAGNIMFGLVDEHLPNAYGEDDDDFEDTFLTREIRQATHFCNGKLRRWLATEEVDEDLVQERSQKRHKHGFKSTTAPTVAANMLVRLRL